MKTPVFKYQDKKLPVVKCKKPSFKCHRGRTWDSTSMFISGEKHDVFLDTSWGEYIYFQYAGNWYKVRMQSTGLEDLAGKSWDLNPFDVDKIQLTVG